MSHNALLILVGFGAIGMGLFFISRRAAYSQRMAAQMKNAWWAAWTRVNYSEEYFRTHYLFGGIFCIGVGLLTIVATLLGGPERARNPAVDAAIGIFVIAIFCSGSIYIIYSSWRFRIKKK